MEALKASFNALKAGSLPREEIFDEYDHKACNQLVRDWKKFLAAMGSPLPEGEHPFKNAPTPGLIEVFFKWRLETSCGRIESKLSIFTLLKEWNRMRRVVRKVSEPTHIYSTAESRSMKKFIERLGSTAGACQKQKPKPVAFLVDVKDLLFFLWNCDEYDYKHPRQFNQLSFSVILMANYGLRPGEVVESSQHRASGEGITYGDVDFSLTRKDGRLIYVLTICLRFRKNHRNRESEADTITLREEMDQSYRSMCPVLHFLAIALADHIFVEQDCPADFEKRYLPSSVNSRPFKIKEEKKGLTLIRKMRKNDYSISDDLLSAISIGKYIVDMGQRAGYRERITPYAFRRGFANGIDPHITPTKRRQMLGHVNDGTYQSYICRTINVDVQSALQGKPQDTEFANFLSSVGYTRDIDAPCRKGQSMSSLNTIVTENDIELMQKKFPRYKRESIIKKCRQDEYSQARQVHYLSSTYDDDSSSAERHLPESHNSRVQPTPSRYMKVALRYDEPRARVVEAFWGKRNMSLQDIVEPLMQMANPERHRLYYPHANPQLDPFWKQFYEGKSAEDNCAILSVIQRSFIDDAGREMNGRPIGPGTAEYCFECAEWYLNSEDWNNHCIKHLGELDAFCGRIIRSGLLILAPLCPFCLGDDRLEPSRRWRFFKSHTSHRGHINNHIESLPDGPITCPHPVCDGHYATELEFRHHLHLSHGITQSHFVRAAAKKSGNLAD